MANNILLISWISEAYWSYNYLLVIILLLIISILLYRIRKLQKTIKKTTHYYRFFEEAEHDDIRMFLFQT